VLCRDFRALLTKGEVILAPNNFVKTLFRTSPDNGYFDLPHFQCTNHDGNLYQNIKKERETSLTPSKKICKRLFWLFRISFWKHT